MSESSARIAGLQRRIARLVTPVQPATVERVALAGAIDARIGGGLQRGRLHEVVAADAEDAAPAAGFTAMLAQRIGGPLVWLRVAGGQGGEGGALYPPGLAEVGIDPDRVLLVLARDPADLLRAAGDVARCTAVGVAVVELWREPRRIDLTVSRRLTLAAEGSGVTPLLLRIAADPVPSAAQTRWGVHGAPSTPLAANAPGAPALDLELLRQRGGPAGWRWRVEWDPDRAEFTADAACLAAATDRTGPSLPGAVVPVPVGGSVADLRAAG